MVFIALHLTTDSMKSNIGNLISVYELGHGVINIIITYLRCKEKTVGTHCHATFKVFCVGDFCPNLYVIGICSMLILLPMWPQECFPLFCVFL